MSSSQLGEPEPLQAPSQQLSFFVQALSSSHTLPSALVVTQPSSESQASLVHGLPSSHSIAAPATHLPSQHSSPLVQALPSSQPRPLSGVERHPIAGSQLSTVHSFPSSQVGAGPPTHSPFQHLSFNVHLSPSSQSRPLTFFDEHPPAGSQSSTVQTLSSSQSTWPWPLHLPWWHLSSLVQLLPSSQKTPLTFV